MQVRKIHLRRRTLLVFVACALSISVPGAVSAAAASKSSGIDGKAVDGALAPFLKVPKEIPVTTPLNAVPPKGKVIYYLSNGFEIEQNEAKGAAAAAAALGWEVKVLSVDDANPSTYNSAMLTAVNSGATAVVVTAVPTVFYQGGLAAAQKAGVYVIDIGSGNAKGPGIIQIEPSPVAGPPWGEVYALAALSDAAKSGKTLHFVQVWASAFAAVADPINAGVEKAITQYCPKKCSYDLLDISLADLNTGKTPGNIVSYLQRNPDVNAVGFSFNGLEPGARQAMDAAGFNKVNTYGVAPGTAQYEELKQGKTSGWSIVPAQMIGWMVVDAVARELASAGGSSVYNTAVAANMLATKSNNAPHDYPKDYESQFKKLWKV